jgi:cupin fold WbuC family metalloprotein
LRINQEVYYETDPVLSIGSEDIEFLKTTAAPNHRKRARVCLHKTEQDHLHEMLITHAKNNYIPPHRHLGKSESYLILQGTMRLITFDDFGNLEKTITLSP